MSYFEELEFEIEDHREKPKVIQTLIVKDDLLKPVIDEIEQEMTKIRLGTSELTHYAIDPGRFGSPVGEALKRLKADPSPNTVKDFITLAKQDLGAKAADRFSALLVKTIALKETN